MAIFSEGEIGKAALPEMPTVDAGAAAPPLKGRCPSRGDEGNDDGATTPSLLGGDDGMVSSQEFSEEAFNAGGEDSPPPSPPLSPPPPFCPGAFSMAPSKGDKEARRGCTTAPSNIALSDAVEGKEEEQDEVVEEEEATSIGIGDVEAGGGEELDAILSGVSDVIEFGIGGIIAR